jgi:hypothetical protein
MQHAIKRRRAGVQKPFNVVSVRAVAQRTSGVCLPKDDQAAGGHCL